MFIKSSGSWKITKLKIYVFTKIDKEHCLKFHSPDREKFHVPISVICYHGDRKEMKMNCIHHADSIIELKS